MRVLLRYFLQGLLVFVPSVLTIAIVVFVFRAVDAWMGLPVPGAGFLATIALIVVIGALASNFVTKRLFELVEGIFRRLPFVKLLYSAIRDVTDAFVGERKGFERPVFVTLDEASGLKAVGFLTRESLDGAGLPDHVGVYLPQSYNFAGQLLVVPRRLVTPLAARGADAMAFIVSGGAAELRGSAQSETAAPEGRPRADLEAPGGATS
ncbi:MAG: DUF502 domain-containing protein [Thermoanaerobaculia bacterium]|nr:DUF502 domain-containing protein [Thermoanaerobaculia bacterium]